MGNVTNGVAARPRRLPLHQADRVVLLLLGDLLALSLALAISLLARFVGLNRALVQTVGMRLVWWIVLAVVWLVIANIVRLYDVRLAALPAKSAAMGGLVACVVCSVYLVIPIWSAPLTASRLTWGAFVIMSALGEMGWRILYGRVFTHARYRRKTIIVGAGEAAEELAAILKQQGVSEGREFLELVEIAPATLPDDPKTLARLRWLAKMAASGAVDDIVVSLNMNGETPQSVADALIACWRAGAQVIPIADYYELALDYVPVHLIGQNIFALLTPEADMGRQLWQAVRRAGDVVTAALGLCCFAVLMPLLAIAIWADCRGPILYRQERVGRGGRPFVILKLRSMIPDAEGNGGAQWATANDCRVTRVGRFLRKSRLDEVPQLWNVLVGDMSLIGPRPERPEFVAQLAKTLPYYGIRHAVRPGLTGWAQVRCGYGSSESAALVKLKYDLYYVKHRGPFLDALIALHTLRTVVRLEGQ